LDKQYRVKHYRPITDIGVDSLEPAVAESVLSA